MQKILRFMLLGIILVSLSACASQVSAQVIKSNKPQNVSPNVSQIDLTTLVNGNTAFGIDLYQSVKSGDDNLFFSPYSLSVALAMTYAGANGTTAQQMANTMHFQLDNSRLHPAFNYVGLALASRGKNDDGKKGSGFKLNVVNATWGQKGFNFLPSYLDTLAINYGAGLNVLDFQKSPEPSRVVINSWVTDQTAGKIKDLIPQGAITNLTRLVLTNAIYFKAAWQSPFDKAVTQNGVFHLNSGKDVTAPMMKQSKPLAYTEGEGYQAVELPYDGNELSMVILLPQSGGFNSFENSLSLQKLNGIISSLQSRQVNLTMPKFQFDTALGLKSALTKLGMPVAFTTDADFSGIDGKKDLFIQDVVHKAFVAVDEAGTEAAAASAVIIGTTSMPANPATVTIDRPFIFLIRDIPTGTVLFLGRVMNPGS